MYDRTHADGERNGRIGDPTRRAFLRTTAVAGASVTGLSTGLVGTTAAQGIETPWLERDGNLIVDPQDRQVVLRGVNVIDPSREDVTGHVEAATDEDRWYARLIRVPMQPQDIGGHGPGAAPVGAFDKGQLESYLTSYVDEVVDLCAQRGAYVILDYHRHWPEGPDWNDPTLFDEVELFWETVAPRYADRSHVLYELFNEPTTPNEGDPADETGEATWLEWRDHAQPWVDTVRAHAPDNLLLIGSPRWSQWTAQAPDNEFEGENLAYVGHIYTQDEGRPYAEYFGEPSEEVPVFMTEFGFAPYADEDNESIGHAAGTRDGAGQEFADLFATYDSMHWTAWSFHDTWQPPILGGGFEPANEWGEWVQDHLSESRNDVFRERETEETCIDLGDVEACEHGEDGLYRDVDGSGSTGSNDVVEFFERFEDDAVQDNTDAFDFNDSGSVGFDDVVALFEQV